MKRRFALAVVLSVALIAMLLAAEAQQAGKTVKLGILSTINPRTSTFFEAMLLRADELIQ